MNKQIQSTCFLGVWTPCSHKQPSRAALKGWISDWDDPFLFHRFWVHKLTLRNTFPIGVSPVMLPYTEECFGQSALKGSWNNQSISWSNSSSAPSERCESDKLINLWRTWSKLGYVESLKRWKCPEGQACCRIYFRINISRLCEYQ